MTPLTDDSDNTIIGVPFERPATSRALCHEETEIEGTQELAMQQQELKIRLADNARQRSSAGMLINKMYSWRGYATSPVIEDNPNRITFVASDKDMAVGTMSINFDSDVGLLVDQLYKDKTDELRSTGRKLCEFIKLAVDGEIKSKKVLAALFHISFITAYLIRGYNDVLIEVNPRHVRFYQRMLCFEVLGEERMNPRVNAPAVLLRLDLKKAHQMIERFGGNIGVADERSLYPYFFSPAEESGIAGRLTNMYPH